MSDCIFYKIVAGEIPSEEEDDDFERGGAPRTREVRQPTPEPLRG